MPSVALIPNDNPLPRTGFDLSEGTIYTTAPPLAGNWVVLRGKADGIVIGVFGSGRAANLGRRVSLYEPFHTILGQLKFEA
jgi:hypothetical protein